MDKLTNGFQKTEYEFFMKERYSGLKTYLLSFEILIP